MKPATRITFPKIAFFGPLLPASVFVFLTVWSWRKWPDLLVDCGAQLYIPWQMSQGKALYLDIIWKNGPFSQLYHSSLFYLFGDSASVIFYSNLIWVFFTWIALYFSISFFFGSFQATVCSLLFLILFAFPHYSIYGGYNFILPYSHESTHGMMLSVFTIAGFVAFHRSRKPVWGLLAGFLFGLVFTTKIEIFLALAAFVFVMPAAQWLVVRNVESKEVLFAWLFLLGAVLSLGMVLAQLLSRMPVDTALRGLCSNWVSVAYDSPSSFAFYREVIGFDDVPGNVRILGRMVVGWVAFLLGFTLLDYLFRKFEGTKALSAHVSLFLVTAILLPLLPIQWDEIGRPVMVICLIVISVLLYRLFVQRAVGVAPDTSIFLLGFSVFSFVLLFKCVLNAHVYHYGFVLLFPSSVIVVLSLLALIPEWIGKAWGNGETFRFLALGGVVAVLVVHFLWSDKFYKWKTLPVGRPDDRIMGFIPQALTRDAVIATALDRLPTFLGSDETMMVLPEGVMLNYLLRVPNPTPYLAFTPYDYVNYGGEAATLERIRRTPPNVIVLVHRPMDEWGVDFFGKDERFGKATMEWIASAYSQVDLIGAQPGTGKRFGIAIFQRNVTLSTSQHSELKDHVRH